MNHRLFCGVLALALASVLAAPAQAQLATYSQDFEGLVQTDPDALAYDGWLVFGNVFSPGGGYLYGYGPFPAPNGGQAFSAIVVGEGGPEQGLQQLSVYSDYGNLDHANGNLIEANVFQEQWISAMDVGSTWVFEFSFRRGNIEGGTTALAFIKTLDPGNGFQLSNFITADMTAVPNMWGGSVLSIFIDASLAGQILQFGFANTATSYEGSGIFYDNLNFIEAGDQCPDDDDENDDDEERDNELFRFELRNGEGSQGSPVHDLSPR